MKRHVAGVLWFLSGWMAGSTAAFVFALPVDPGLAVGLSLGAIVWWDPAGLLWKRRRPVDLRRSRPVEEFVAELDREPAGLPAEETVARD